MSSGSNINNNIEFKRKGNSKYSKYAKNIREFEKIIGEDYSSIIDLSKEESSNNIEEIINLGSQESQESQDNEYEYEKIEDSKKSNNKNEDNEPLFLIDSNSMSNERNDKKINIFNNKTNNECKNIKNKIYPKNNIFNNKN